MTPALRAKPRRPKLSKIRKPGQHHPKRLVESQAASIGANECGGNKKAFGINNWRKSLTCDAREFNLSAVARRMKPVMSPLRRSCHNTFPTLHTDMRARGRTAYKTSRLRAMPQPSEPR